MTALYGSELMENALLRWQAGAWKQLTALSLDRLSAEPQKARLAMMVAAAWFQLGDRNKAGEAVVTAIRWGASREDVATMLVSGIYNCLGRVSAIDRDWSKAHAHFAHAIRYGDPETDQTIAVCLRTDEQLEQLGMGERSRPGGKKNVRGMLQVTTAEQIDLGKAWAGNTVNTVIFRHHGVVSWKQYQYTAFYIDNRTLRVLQRNLESNAVVTADIRGEYNLDDAHNSISLGVDRAGHIHMSYDHHGTRLKYRRTLLPEDIRGWSDELPMTGQHEENVTYPTFILPLRGNPLLMLYRDGHWKQGTAYLKSYDEVSESWHDYPLPVLSGAEMKPWTSNAYWNHPVRGKEGDLHISYVWRTDYSSDEKRINNINIGYACSYDWGHHWFTSNARPYALPITQVNSEIVWSIPPESNLINQTSMALDSKDRPHILYYADDGNGIPQYQHVWSDGKQWRHGFCSSREDSFALSGGGTLRIPISRPEIVIDEHDNVYMIHRGNETENRMAVTFLPAPDYDYESRNTLVLHEKSVGYAEPVIDRLRWERENVLSILLQYNEQPDGDVEHTADFRNVTLLDVVFELNDGEGNA